MRISDWSSDVCSSDLLPKVLQALTAGSGIRSESGVARCHAELANYFAAAFLMPYQAFYEAAEGSNYDVDRLAAAFGVSFEQVCHRLTTLQREGSRGVPFFFLRVDKAGNVTKRRSEEHTSELQSLMRISYAVFCLNKKTPIIFTHKHS